MIITVSIRRRRRAQPDGEDTLFARVYGADIPALKQAALDKGRELYGPDAQLQIERVEDIATALRAPFQASIIVRRVGTKEART